MKLDSTAVLVLMLLLGACGKSNSKADRTAAMNEVTIPVEGMSCNRCASRVQESLTSLDGVGDAEVDLERKHVIVQFDSERVSLAKLTSAIEEVGFNAGRPSRPSR